MDRATTAKQIEVSLKAGGSKVKKAFWCRQYPRPLTVQSGNSFKTGKHGGSKTRLSITDYFTDQKLTILVDSFEPFFEANSNPNFLEQEVLVLEKGQNSIKVLTCDYQTLDLDGSYEDLKVEEYYRLHSFVFENITYHKIGV